MNYRKYFRNHWSVNFLVNLKMNKIREILDEKMELK
ncbi:MAG: hypothetical protein BWX60_00483 [Candidatus Marinimicrobia bacterium ADurb.Bin030]|nr:MAG: hypothetical protein BWX60_00483 [Candidatus Marinimicrobia bacterium ADurb.Bin030]